MRPLFFIVLVTLLTSTYSFASEQKPAPILLCEAGSMYLPLKMHFVVDTVRELRFNDRTIPQTWWKNENGRIVLTFSESECEDVTVISFDANALDKLAEGSLDYIFGTLTQKEPDLKMEANIYCTLQ